MPESYPVTALAEPLSVAILAGGQSKRMGTPKALLRISPGGPTLLEAVAATVAMLTDDLFIVGGEREVTVDADLPLHEDHYPNAGPLGGMCTALEIAAHPRCLVVSCDMPFLSGRVLEAMRAVDQTGDALVPVMAGSSRQGGDLAYQTLHAIYRQRCVDYMRFEIAAGNLKTIAWFPRATIQIYPLDQVRPFDPELLTFFSVNTPDALARAREIYARRS